MVRRSENGLVSDDESVKRLKLLAYGAGVVVGTAVFGADQRRWLSSCAQTPVPGRIGMTEVEQVEAATRALRVLDYQFGGGGCRDALVALLSWARRLLGASSTDQVRQRLFRALGDLQNLVGWTTFDVGLLDCSRSNFATALDYAQQSGDSGLIANIMYWMGRVYLHQKAANEALKWFQLGQIPAHACGSEHAVAVLCGNEAWAHAMMGDAGQADMLLGRSRDALAKVNLSEMPDWARFYNDTDLRAMVGTVHTELSADDPQHASTAISAFDHALTGYIRLDEPQSSIHVDHAGYQPLPARQHRPRYPGRPPSLGAGPEGTVPASDRPDETITDRGATAIHKCRLPATF
jgi:hypothetical protein